MTPSDAEREPAPSSAKQTRSVARAFVATNYLLGKRQGALAEGALSSDPVALAAIAEISQQLNQGVQQHRARALAAEVGRIMRALSAQKLK